MQDKIDYLKIGLIDDPAYAMRSEMDDEKLRELAASIDSFGLMQPITVRAVGKRYEVVAGHRRLKACQILKKQTIPAIVKVWDDKETDMGRMHENLFREDVNPVDEADYLHNMVEVHKMPMEDLVRATGKSEAYIKARLDLIQYPAYLLEALHKEAITLGAASWLVRITDENVRGEYTRFAISQGVTAATAKQWYMTWQMGNLPREAATFVPQTDPESGKPRTIEMPCVICRQEADIHTLEMHYVHGSCVSTMEHHFRTVDQENMRARDEHTTTPA